MARGPPCGTSRGGRTSIPDSEDAAQVSSTGAVSRLLTVATVRPSTGHGLPDQVEVMVVDREHAEPELVPPPLLVLDEVQIVDERADGCLIAGDEVDIPAPRHEIRRHFDLVRLIVGDLPYRGERLKEFAAAERAPGRVEDDPVAFGHSAQHVWFAVIGLSETTSRTLLDVVAANGVDPVGHDTHGRDRCRQMSPPSQRRTRSAPRAVDEVPTVDQGRWFPRFGGVISRPYALLTRLNFSLE